MKKPSSQRVLIGVVLLVAAFGIWTIVSAPAPPAVPAAPLTPTTDPNRNRAYVECKRLVREQLKAPDSAVFGSLLGGDATVARNGQNYVVKTFVDAPNSLGATVRTRFTCVTQPNDPVWDLVSLDTNS